MLPAASCRQGGGIEVFQVLQGCPAGNVAGIEPAQAIGNGKDPGIRQHEHVVFIAAADPAGIRGSGVFYLITTMLAGSLNEAHRLTVAPGRDTGLQRVAVCVHNTVKERRELLVCPWPRSS